MTGLAQSNRHLFGKDNTSVDSTSTSKTDRNLIFDSEQLVNTPQAIRKYSTIRFVSQYGLFYNPINTNSVGRELRLRVSNSISQVELDIEVVALVIFEAKRLHDHPCD